MRKIGRRDFIKYVSLGFAGGYVSSRGLDAVAGMMSGGGGMGGGGMGGGGMTICGSGTTIIDPRPGGIFREPVVMPNLSNTAGEVLVNVTAMPSNININGKMANLLTYNGYYPAPTIKVKNSDRLKINFENQLPMLGANILGHNREMTNLHTHGLHVSPSGNADNVMLMFMPGDSFTYEYDLSKQAAGTLNFYHPHIHGTVAEQDWGGLAGAIVVEDENTLLSGYETHLMVLKDISLSGTDPEPYTSMMDFMHGKEGNTIMVNGQVNPVLNIQPGQVQRWRIINASNARFYKLSLESHTINVIGTDGGLLDKPYPMPYILVSPGERVDLLVKATQSSGNYRLLALPYSRGGGSCQQVTLMTMTYKGSRAGDSVPSVINPEAVRINATPVITRTMTLSMGHGRGYINGISLSDAGAYSIASEVGTFEVWNVVNQSGMDHPFHQHVNPCQVLSISGGDTGYSSFYTKAPAWKDTVIIPAMGSAKLLVPVMDYTGMTMFHCHILEHEDIGMVGIWDIMAEPM